jgi:hypothetical protein
LLAGALALAILTAVAVLDDDDSPSTGGTQAGAGQDSATTKDPHRASPNWRLARHFDFSANDGGWTDTGMGASRDSSISRLSQAQFGTGPQERWLTVTAQRASVSSPIYSVDLLGRAYPVPNYFAVDLVYQLPDVGAGMWPAPLWLRPLETPADPKPEGEIDLVEWFGSRMLEFDEAAGSVHETPYGIMHHQESLPLPALAGSARRREHHVRFEKTPGVMTWYVDDMLAGSLKRGEFDKDAGRGSWNAMFENPKRKWYPRITYQVGPGADGDQAGNVPPGWRRSKMVIKRLDVYTATF